LNLEASQVPNIDHFRDVLPNQSLSLVLKLFRVQNDTSAKEDGRVSITGINRGGNKGEQLPRISSGGTLIQIVCPRFSRNTTQNSPKHHNTTTILRPFFRDHPGEPVPEENFWTLWCKERLTEADTETIRLGATPSGLTSAHLHHPPLFTGRMPFLPPDPS